MSLYKSIMIIIACAATGLILSSCGTLSGIGSDINAAGRGLQRAAR